MKVKQITLLTLSILSTISATALNISASGSTLQNPETWTNWKTGNGQTQTAIAMSEFTVNGEKRLFQTVQGRWDPYWIYVRSTADGVFDSDDQCKPSNEKQTNLECWDRTGVNGQSSRQMSLTTFNERLYLAVRGANSKIYTKSMNSAGVWDSTWNENGGNTTNTIAQAAFNGRLYQAVRGNGSNRIFFRSSADGVFSATDTSERWIEINGQTVDDMTLSTMGSTLFMSVKGSTGRVFTRSTTNGTNWTAWSETPNTALAKTAPVLANMNGTLYQSMSGFNNNIYTRASKDGITWTPWVYSNGQTDSRVEMTAFNGKLYQSVKGLADNVSIYTRYLINTTTYSSVTSEFNFKFKYNSDFGNTVNLTTSDVKNKKFSFENEPNLIVKINGNPQTALEQNSCSTPNVQIGNSYNINTITKDSRQATLVISDLQIADCPDTININETGSKYIIFGFIMYPNSAGGSKYLVEINYAADTMIERDGMIDNVLRMFESVEVKLI